MNKADLEEFRKELDAFYEGICKTRNDNLKEKGKYILSKTKESLDFLENRCYVEKNVMVSEKPSINNTPGLLFYLLLKISNGNMQRTVKEYERAVE